MAEQLPLDLPLRPALGRADFVASLANQEALTQIDGWADWPQGKLVLYGPAGSGKTHLAMVWADMADAQVLSARDLRGTGPQATALVVEDVPQIAGQTEQEEALFHTHNRILSQGGRLLLTGQDAPSLWRIGLPDLASRIQGTLSVALSPPDDALLSYILLKLFADRQVTPSPKAIETLVLYMERSFAEAGRLVAEIDRRAMAERRKINDTLAREVLGIGASAQAPLFRPDGSD